MRQLLLPVLFTLLLLSLRLNLAAHVAFGDAEAMYLAYAYHPQPSYLDHPGLIALLAKALYVNDASAGFVPRSVHFFTSVAAALLPWFGVACARVLGASPRHSLRTFYALAFVPGLSVGLFALSPELPLIYLWLASLALVGAALMRVPERPLVHLLVFCAAASIALATLSDIAGVALGLSVFFTVLHKKNRLHLRSLAPLGGLIIAATLLAPLLLWEVARGLPLARRGFANGELSLAGLATLLGGQLLYVTPPFLLLGLILLRQLSRERDRSPVTILLYNATLFPVTLLTLASLWSTSATPNALTPAYLALCLYLALADLPERTLGILTRSVSRVAVVVGLIVATLGWAWVRTDLPMRFLGPDYEAHYDPSNDFYAWQNAKPLLAAEITKTRKESGHSPILVGPHWIICAQIEVLLDNTEPVGCASPVPDDYDIWLPRDVWLAAPVLLFVTDNRFALTPDLLAPSHQLTSIERLPVIRAGQQIREIFVARLERRTGTAQR